MDKTLANQVVSAIQATFEACTMLAAEIPPQRRKAVDDALRRLQQAKAAIMFELS